MPQSQLLQDIAELKEKVGQQLAKTIVGQKDVAELLLITLLARGHALLTGAPGLGKTLLVHSLAQTLDLKFKRIQFTPDLMPADICGTEIVEEDPQSGKRTFRFVQGPIFANILLADEINRTPPKTQAALLEAMQEHQVTAAGQTHTLEEPFFVLATQNPVELEGTYPLPEAQLDRFLFNINIDYLPLEEEIEMVARTTAPAKGQPEAVLHGAEILKLQEQTREVPVADELIDYAVRISAATRPARMDEDSPLKEKIRWGAGSRAAQSLILASKARALLNGRVNVAVEDLDTLAVHVLRHRIIPSFQAEAEGTSSDSIIAEILQTLKVRS